MIKFYIYWLCTIQCFDSLKVVTTIRLMNLTITFVTVFLLFVVRASMTYCSFGRFQVQNPIWLLRIRSPWLTHPVHLKTCTCWPISAHFSFFSVPGSHHSTFCSPEFDSQTYKSLFKKKIATLGIKNLGVHALRENVRIYCHVVKPMGETYFIRETR